MVSAKVTQVIYTKYWLYWLADTIRAYLSLLKLLILQEVNIHMYKQSRSLLMYMKYIPKSNVFNIQLCKCNSMPLLPSFSTN